MDTNVRIVNRKKHFKLCNDQKIFKNSSKSYDVEKCQINRVGTEFDLKLVVKWTKLKEKNLTNFLKSQTYKWLLSFKMQFWGKVTLSWH